MESFVSNVNSKDLSLVYQNTVHDVQQTEYNERHALVTGDFQPQTGISAEETQETRRSRSIGYASASFLVEWILNSCWLQEVEVKGSLAPLRRSEPSMYTS